MSEPFDLPNIRERRNQMSVVINDLTAGWSQTLEEMYRCERRIVALEAELAEAKALLREVFPVEDTLVQVTGRSAENGYQHWLDRRDALLNPNSYQNQ